MIAPAAAATFLFISTVFAKPVAAVGAAALDAPHAAMVFPRRQLQLTEEEFCTNKLTALELHMFAVETELGITMNKTDSIIANETWTMPSSYECMCNGGSVSDYDYSVLLVDCSIRHQFTLHRCKKWWAPVNAGARRLGFFDDIGDQISDLSDEVTEFFVGSDNNSNNVEPSSESNIFCLESEDVQVNQLIEEQVRFVREGDDTYHLTHMSWKSSDENNSLSPVEKVIHYEDGSPAYCNYKDCLCSLCDGDPNTLALDCTPWGGENIECGSDDSEAIKNDSGPYLSTFDFGVIVKTPEPEMTGIDSAAAGMEMEQAGEEADKVEETNSGTHRVMPFFITVAHLAMIAHV